MSVIEKLIGVRYQYSSKKHAKRIVETQGYAICARNFNQLRH